MKKSFSLLLAFAMVFSVFAPIALAADSEKELTIEEKYQALEDAGIFAGVNADGDAALDENMTRAQAARIIALVFELDLDHAPANPTFSDVGTNHWAYDAVEAAVEAGFINGRGDGTFDPSGLVTHQELAVMLALAYENLLGFEIDADATVNAKVAPWAEQYVAFAVNNNILPALNDYTQSANRGALTYAAYQAYADVNVPDVVGIASAQPSNFNEVTVELTAALNEDQQKDAQFEVSMGSIKEKVTEVEFSNGGKTAVVTLDRDFREGTYTVTLSGIENLDEDAASAEFKATEERVVEIQFTTPSDTLPQAESVEITFEALNQYGQPANVSASDFLIYVSDKDVEDTVVANYDEQSFTLSTYIEDDDERNRLQRGQGLYIRLLHERSGVAADKTFTIGDRPIISKVELGKLIDENGDEIEYIRSGRTGYIEVAAYDQYGNRINNADILNGNAPGVNEVSVFTNHRDLNVGVGEDEVAFVDGDNDGYVDLALTADKDLTGTFTVTAFSYGGSVTKNVEVKALRVPASVEIPRFDGVLADGDKNKHIPFKAYDANGEELTASEIADNADKFYITSWGPFVIDRDDAIELSGDHRGKIKIKEVNGRGQGQIMVQIDRQPNTQVTLTLTASAERVPDRLTWHTQPAAQILNGAQTDLRIQVKDQYGENFDKNDEYYVGVTFEPVSNASGAQIVSRTDAGDNIIDVDGNTVYYKANWFHDKTFDIKTTANATGSYRLKVALYNDDDRVVHNLGTRTIRIIDGRDSDDRLTYSVKLEKFNEDGKVMAIAKVLDATYKTEAGKLKTVPELMKEIKIEATNDSGNKVAIVQDIINVTSSNNNVARGVQTDDGKWYIAGVDNGTANLTVSFRTATGSDVAVISVEAVNAGSNVQSIALSKSNKNVDKTKLHGLYVWDAKLAEKLTVKDQYGNEFISEKDKREDTLKYADLLGLTYSVKVTDWGEAKTGQIVIDSETGQLNASNIGSIKSFDIVITAPNGTSATFSVYVY